MEILESYSYNFLWKNPEVKRTQSLHLKCQHFIFHNFWGIWKFLFSTLCHSWAIIGKSLLFPACDKISILLRCGSRWNWRSPFFGLQKHNFLQRAMLGEQKTVLLAIVGWYTKVSTQGCFLEEMAKDLSSGIATYLKSNLAENI